MGEPSTTVVQPVSVHRESSVDESGRQLALSVRLGRAKYRRDDLVKLDSGSTVVLDSLATEPVDVLVDGQLVARGEVLLVDGFYCVRICEVIGLSGQNPIGEVLG